MVDQIRFFAGAARLLQGLSAGEYLAGHTSMIRREPVGVCRAGDAVELPAHDGRVEVGAGHRGGEQPRPQALRHDPRVHAADGRDHGRAPAAGRLQCDLRGPRHGPGPRHSSHARHGVDHRHRAGRHGGCSRRLGRSEAGPPRARRQGACRRLRRRRPREGGTRDRRRPPISTPGRTARRRRGCSPHRRSHRTSPRPWPSRPQHENRRDRRRGRRLRPAQQFRAARAGQRDARARPRSRPGPLRAVTSRATAASCSSRRS